MSLTTGSSTAIGLTPRKQFDSHNSGRTFHQYAALLVGTKSSISADDIFINCEMRAVENDSLLYVTTDVTICMMMCDKSGSG